MTKWCVLSDQPESPRFRALDAELKSAGLETDFTYFTADEVTLPEVLDQTRSNQGQIRIAGRLGAPVLPLLIRLPSAILSLKACDALVCDHDEWWPRFFLVEGLNQAIAADASTLDLGGSVFILGATPEARAVVASLSRIGFNKMILSDPSEAACLAFVEEMRRSYFGIQFQVVARDAVTQLPGVCSIAVNTLTQAEDAGAVTELAYFNFLKPGGFWLDLCIFPPNFALQTEASSVGAQVLSGIKAIAFTDRLWAETALKTKIDVDSYIVRLSAP